MNRLLKTTLMVMGAGGVLLLAGAFPLAGAPGVYQSGLMVLLGQVVMLLCLWGAWRIARGHKGRLLCGMLCMFFACAGIVAAWKCTLLAIEFPGKEVEGGVAALWFGRMGLICYVLVGALFAVIFGFLTLRLMNRRLWLAALHAWVVVMLVGVDIDFVAAGVNQVIKIELPPSRDGSTYIGFGETGEGKTYIRIAMLDFDIRHHEAASCTLLRHANGRWVPIGEPKRQGADYVYGEERWPADSLRSTEGMPRRFLLLPGEPPRMLLEGPTAVKEYRATCRITLIRQEGDEVRDEVLRVNHPISIEGYTLYLMSYKLPTHKDDPIIVEMELRRAPGRKAVLLAMLGIILCAFGWAFSPQKEEPQA